MLTVRPHFGVLVTPVLVLGITSGLCSFLFSRTEISWQQQTILSIAVLAAFFFWLVPSIRFMTQRTVLSTNRLTNLRGLTAKKINQISWGEISRISFEKRFFSAAGEIYLHRQSGEDFVITKVASPKKLSKALESYLATQNQTIRKNQS